MTSLFVPGRDGKMTKTYKVMLVHYNPPNEFGVEYCHAVWPSTDVLYAATTTQYFRPVRCYDNTVLMYCMVVRQPGTKVRYGGTAARRA
eukprot:1059938-Rhodomonas_salina.1